ncbi:hydrogenase maturation protease [Kitasatospora sp. DSM 101779]|uniref:hydrogenase maturation protease n=1 Tax=Kitasatospora sp. DSM 101779 TaxID=2853165 RepID=UPI0021D9F9C8|nr:hydrogenase maturation protease [Kitasatospora sp. DSM 101779]MCU7826498.1 hydrogenase maturation protease [Kitasatospora sp. DSM 101779]
MTGRVVVIGVGNPFRRDDGAGPAVVEALRARGTAAAVLAVSDGDPGRLLEMWRPADTVVVAEALRSPAGRPGRLHTVRAERAASLAATTASTHGLGLAETVALAAALDRLPRALVVHAVEGADFTAGVGLTGPVRSALPALVRLVADSVRAGQRPRPPSGGVR